MKDTHRSSIVLQNLTQTSPFEQYAKPYQKYIALKNNIDYHSYNTNYIDSITTYDIIIGINDYCIFRQKLFLDLIDINNLENHYLVLPKNTSMPLHLIPFIAKNCIWLRDFLMKYQKSKIYNLEKFLTINNLLTSNLILFSDNLLDNNNSIIESLIDLDIESIEYRFKHNNNILGLL